MNKSNLSLKQVFCKLCGCLVSASLTTCSSSNSPSASTPSAQLPSSLSCSSFNQGDPIDSKLGEDKLTIKPVVDRRIDTKRTVVLIPTNGSSQIFWIYRTTDGWRFADKQTVAIASEGQLDLQPMHRLNKRVYPETVQIIALSSEHWDKKIIIQPSLEGSASRWGRMITFPVRISVQGQVHAFLGIERGVSGNALPSYLESSRPDRTRFHLRSTEHAD
jgi:hypothetical protein